MKQNRNRLQILVVFMLLLALMLAACGGGDEPAPTADTRTEEVAPTVEPTQEPTPVPTAVPTNTPAPTPEPTATPEPEIAFVELNSPDSGITLQYPEGWEAQDLFGLIYLASNEELMQADSLADAEGIAMIVTAGPEDDLVSVDPAELIQNTLDEFMDESTITDGPTDVEINGRDALVATFSGTSDGAPLVGKVYLIEYGSNAAIALGLSSPDMEEEAFGIFEAIVNSMEVTEPVAAGGLDLPPEEGFLLYGDVVEGSVITDSEPTVWTFIGLEGEAIDIIVKPTDDNLDVVVDVVNENGESILGGELDEAFDTEVISNLTIPASGTYYILLRGFAGSLGDYELSIAEAGALSDVPTGDVDLVYGDTVTGEITGTEEQTWTFAAAARDLVDVTAFPVDEEFDLILDLVDSNGRSILEDGAMDKSFDTEYIRTLMIEESGIYTIVISGYDGSVGTYELTLGQPLGGLPGTLLIAEDELEAADEEHIFPFYSEAGERVVIEAQPLEFELDIVVQVWSDDNEEMLNEQDFSTGFEEVEFIVPETGNYYFLVKGYEGSVGPYQVTLLGTEFTIFEVAAGDVIFGRLAPESYIEYDLGVEPGDEFLLTVETEDEIDLVIEILDFDGNVLSSADEALSGETEQLPYVFDGAESSVVIIRISEFFGDVGEYFLYVEFGG